MRVEGSIGCARRPARRRRGRAARLVVAALGLSGVAALGPSCRQAHERGERIVLITLDTLRYDRLHGAAEWPADMPELRRFAAAARSFGRHYSATSTTQPTHATLLTGLHPWEHGVSRNGAVLAAEIETLAERLRGAGFRSAAVVASFPLHRRFGFDQGFDRYDDEFDEAGHGEWLDVTVPGGRFQSHADAVTAKALEMLDDLGGAKQFYWFHYFDPHSPYGDSDGRALAELPEIDRYLRGGGRDVEPLLERARRGYSRDVRFLDARLHELLERLQRDSSDFETHVVVVADHGESFGEEGSIGHNKRLTKEQIHVPLLIHSPRAAAGSSDLATGSIDVAATILALAGIPDAAAGGRDLLAADPADGFAFGMRRSSDGPFHEIATDGSVLVHDGSEFFAAGGGRIFTGNASGVRADDGGAVDPETSARLTQAFARFERALRGAGLDELRDPETREALEALGYVE